MMKSRVKRIIIWLLTVLLASGVILFAGCGKSGSSGSEADPSGQISRVSVTSEAEDSGKTGSVSSASEAEDSASAVTESSSISEADADEPAVTDEEAEPEDEAEVETGDGEDAEAPEDEEASLLNELGSYTSKEDVALYLHQYGQLPMNYITKKEAEKLGWDNRAGNLQDVAPGMSIGGTRFGNYEGLLPDKKGRTWYECDINYEGGYRGGERLVYSNDGLIYYTGDHYKSFEQLY